MFDEKMIPNRQEGERLVAFLRGHWIVLFGIFLTTAIIFFIPVLIYELFLSSYLDFFLAHHVVYVIVVFFICLYYLMGVLIMYNRFISYHYDVWIVTSERIIAMEENNVFNRATSEQLLEKVQDVTATQKGMLQTIFNFGDLEVQTAGEKERFDFENVPHPFEVAETINKLLAKKTETPGV